MTSWLIGLSIVGLIFTCLYALYDHKETLCKFNATKWPESQKHLGKLAIIWGGLLSSLAILIIASISSVQMDKEMAELKKASAPKSLKYRITEVLNDIDPRIMQALSNGNPRAIGTVEESKLARLQSLCREPGASEYLTVTLTGHSFVGTTGTELGAAIVLSSNLIQKIQ